MAEKGREAERGSAALKFGYGKDAACAPAEWGEGGKVRSADPICGQHVGDLQPRGVDHLD